MKHLTTIHMLLSALVVAAAVVATPVEHTNGVISINDEELALEFTTVNRGDCPDCNGLFLAYPYHLIDADERRGLVKRSPKKAKGKGKKGFKKTKKGGKKGGKKLGKGAKKSSPLTVPALGLGAPGGGALAFGVPGTGFGGFVAPFAAQGAFDYVTG